jgi:hypothetical protein
MSEEFVPKRRPTDPIPGTKGPQRGSNDAFTQKMPKAPAPTPKPAPVEGTLGKRWRETKDSIIDSTVDGGKPKPFKEGGLVQSRGWGKARKRGC